MRVLITGASGRLGLAFAAAAPTDWNLLRLRREDLDITDPAAVADLVGAGAPDVVVNLAAMTDVDACERDPDAAMRVNADAVGTLADAAERCGAGLVQMSTSFVFDGTSDRPYVESDATAPVNAYGRSKVAGEEAARRASRCTVIRTDALFGAGGSFADRSLVALRSGASVTAIADRTCSPTYVPDLAAALIDIVGERAAGIVHLAGPTACSWADLLGTAARIGSLPGSVVRGSVEDLSLVARRPRNSSLVSERLGGLGVAAMPPLEDAVVRWLAIG